MKKFKSILILLIISLTFFIISSGSSSAKLSEKNPMLHREGKNIVDGDGNIIKFKGINAGGWLLWEGWIWGEGFTSETHITEKLEELAGKESTEKFRQEIYENFITEDDIKAMSEMGLNVIRVPFNHTILEDDDRPYEYKENGWVILDNLLIWAKKYNIYIILDLHSAPGGQSDLFVADPEKELLWASKDKQDRTVAIWKAIAERYKDRRIIAGYDLLNEPKAKDGQDLINLYKRIIKEIRKVDKNHIIIIGANTVMNDFSMFTEPPDNNSIYEFHMYSWFGDFRKKQLDYYKKISEKQNMPVFCGEFGENSYKMILSTVELFDEYNITGWTMWTWKKIPNKYPYLIGIEPSDKWMKVINWVAWATWPSPKPSEAETVEGMKEFIESIKFKNNLKNEKMIKAINL